MAQKSLKWGNKPVLNALIRKYAVTCFKGRYQLKQVTLSIPHTGLKIFSKRAVLRFGMLLRDSKIAKEVRTQLLNVFEYSTDTQKTQAIDEEKRLLTDISMAYASGDVNQLLSAPMPLSLNSIIHLLSS